MRILGVLSKSYLADRPNYISGVDFWRVERPLLELKRRGWDIDVQRRILPDDAAVGNPETEAALTEIG